MTIIADHTFFPHAADWSMNPVWKRRWLTGISSALTNAEQRQALRSLPLHTLSFSITAASLPERSRLDARIDQALKSGYGCAPFYGKATNLTANAAAGANSLTVLDVANAWPWAVGDYAALIGDDDTVFDAWQVTNVAGSVLTLAGILVNTWFAGTIVRPVLFGRFNAEKSRQLTNWNSAIKISITQLAAERNAQLGNVVPDTGVGVGHQTIETSNTIG